MIKTIKRTSPFVILLICYVIISVIGMIYTPLFDEDEGFYAEAARRMMETGDYITIEVNGQPRYDKPILFYWFEVISIYIFGLNEFAVRLPSFLFFLLFLKASYDFIGKHFNKAKAEIGIIFCICTVQFLILSRAAVTDNLLNYFLATALFNYYDFINTGKRTHLRKFYFALGFGFLAKGPIAWAIAFLVIIVFHFTEKKTLQFLKAFSLKGLLTTFLIPAPWFYLAFRESGEFLLSDFFIKHNLGRFTTTMESHGGNWWYYFPVLVLAFIPFSDRLLLVLRKPKFSPTEKYCLVWFLVGFVLFSFSKTQLPHYISCGFAPLIVVLAYRSNTTLSKASKIQMVTLSIFFVLLPIILSSSKIEFDAFTNLLLNQNTLVFDQLYLSISAGLLIGLIVSFYLKYPSYYFSIILFLVNTSLFIYKIGILQQAEVKEIGLILKDEAVEIFHTDHYNPSLSFYARKSLKINPELTKGNIYFIKGHLLDSEKMTILHGERAYYIIRYH